MRKLRMFPMKIARNWRWQNDAGISIAVESSPLDRAGNRNVGVGGNRGRGVHEYEAIFLFVSIRGAFLARALAWLFCRDDDPPTRRWAMGLSDTAISRSWFYGSATHGRAIHSHLFRSPGIVSMG